MTDTHITVLKTAAVDALELTPSSVVLDCTLGAGGHAREILSRLEAGGTYIGLDADNSAIAANQSLYEADATVHLEHANFSDIQNVCKKYNVRPTAILADLGWQSAQFNDASRGFSFQTDGPLVMTFGDPEQHTFTAYNAVNEWEESSLADVINGYGEERFARRIARAIVEARATAPIERTKQLADIVSAATPGWYGRGRIHPATKTFQALRIAVNDELGVLRTLLEDGFSVLAPQGRMAIISFHSLEDRLVKRSFAEKHQHGVGELLTKKPITADADEISNNPRARSAKMRVITKLTDEPS